MTPIQISFTLIQEGGEKPLEQPLGLNGRFFLASERKKFVAELYLIQQICCQLKQM